jgi:hypothetical protein
MHTKTSSNKEFECVLLGLNTIISFVLGYLVKTTPYLPLYFIIFLDSSNLQKLSLCHFDRPMSLACNNDDS